MNNTKQLTLFSNEPQTPGLTMYVVNGRNYRCVRKPDNDIDLGRWEFEYKGNWHDIKNMKIRRELNQIAGYYAR